MKTNKLIGLVKDAARNGPTDRFQQNSRVHRTVKHKKKLEKMAKRIRKLHEGSHHKTVFPSRTRQA
jgi:thiamine kinase-like enzyme